MMTDWADHLRSFRGGKLPEARAKRRVKSVSIAVQLLVMMPRTADVPLKPQRQLSDTCDLCCWQVETVIRVLVGGVTDNEITVTAVLDAVDQGLTDIDRPGAWLDRQQTSRCRASGTIKSDLSALRDYVRYLPVDAHHLGLSAYNQRFKVPECREMTVDVYLLSDRVLNTVRL